MRVRSFFSSFRLMFTIIIVQTHPVGTTTIFLLLLWSTWVLRPVDYAKHKIRKEISTEIDMSFSPHTQHARVAELTSSKTLPQFAVIRRQSTPSCSICLCWVLLRLLADREISCLFIFPDDYNFFSSFLSLSSSFFTRSSCSWHISRNEIEMQSFSRIFLNAARQWTVETAVAVESLVLCNYFIVKWIFMAGVKTFMCFLSSTTKMYSRIEQRPAHNFTPVSIAKRHPESIMIMRSGKLFRISGKSGKFRSREVISWGYVDDILSRSRRIISGGKIFPRFSDSAAIWFSSGSIFLCIYFLLILKRKTSEKLVFIA